MALTDSTNPMQGVSGPGKFAKRTDLQYQPESYGQGVEMTAQMQGAPLAKTPNAPAATGTEVKQAASNNTQADLYSISDNPGQDIMHGTDVGPGAGSDALKMRQPDDTNFRAAIQEYLPVINYVASLPNTSPDTRRALRQIVDGI